MQRPNFSFPYSAVPVIFLASIASFGAMVAPSNSHAQDGTAAGATGQATAAPTATAQPKPAVVLPDGDGKAIATEFCQDCHKLTNLTKAGKTPDDWRDTLQLMMDRGARLPQDKVDTLVQYLSKNFGPKTEAPQSAAPAATATPAAAPSSDAASTAAAQPKPVVVLPDGDGKAIATENCQACHKLTNLTKAHKSLDDWRDTVQLMMDRGANVPADKIDTLVQYLAKNFGPKTASSAGTPSSDAPSAPPAPSNQ